jgi:hypothetical protein
MQKKRCYVNRFYVHQQFYFDKVAERRKAKSRNVAEGRTKLRNVASNRGDLQVQDRPNNSSLPSLGDTQRKFSYGMCRIGAYTPDALQMAQKRQVLKMQEELSIAGDFCRLVFYRFHLRYLKWNA